MVKRFKKGIKEVGLEQAYGQYLGGKNGIRRMQKIAKGEWKPLKTEYEIEPKEGYDERGCRRAESEAEQDEITTRNAVQRGRRNRTETAHGDRRKYGVESRTFRMALSSPGVQQVGGFSLRHREGSQRC